MYGGQASLGRACADLFQQARLNTDCKINFPGWVGVGVGGVVGKAENIATQPSLAGAWAELGKSGKSLKRGSVELGSQRQNQISLRFKMKTISNERAGGLDF